MQFPINGAKEVEKARAKNISDKDSMKKKMRKRNEKNLYINQLSNFTSS